MIKITLLELMLIIGSVFIYRSLWIWLDRCPWLHTDLGLIISLLFGIALVVYALIRLNKCLQKGDA